MTFLKDPTSGKIYNEASLASISAVDPNHWTTDIQNLQTQVVALQAQIDDINNVQIPAKQAEQAAYQAFIAANP